MSRTVVRASVFFVSLVWGISAHALPASATDDVITGDEDAVLSDNVLANDANFGLGLTLMSVNLPAEGGGLGF